MVNTILRHSGYKAVFIRGVALYGVGALLAWPCLLHRSFGGYCAVFWRHVGVVRDRSEPIPGW